MPEDLEISSKVVESVTLETRGPAGRLGEMAGARPALVLDFSTVHGPGERTFNLDERNVSLPRGIQLVRVIPAQLQFMFEPRARREVPVEVHLSRSAPGLRGCERRRDSAETDRHWARIGRGPHAIRHYRSRRHQRCHWQRAVPREHVPRQSRGPASKRPHM